jgi:enamine deaminase RidA (YjgF/YER057c/UK114 family)
MHHEVIHGPSMPQPMGHYSHAVRVGDLVFVAGQPGIDLGASSDPATATAVPGDSRPSGVRLSGTSRQY